MLFFGNSPTGQTRRRIFTHDGSNDADSRKDVPFCAKFGWNRCSSFDSMHVFRFREFGLKRPFTPQNWAVLGFFDILNGEQCAKFSTKHILARVRVVWAIVRKNPSTCLTSMWVHQKGHKDKKLVIFHPCAQKPPVDGYVPNLAQP